MSQCMLDDWHEKSSQPNQIYDCQNNSNQFNMNLHSSYWENELLQDLQQAYQNSFSHQHPKNHFVKHIHGIFQRMQSFKIKLFIFYIYKHWSEDVSKAIISEILGDVSISNFAKSEVLKSSKYFNLHHPKYLDQNDQSQLDNILHKDTTNNDVVNQTDKDAVHIHRQPISLTDMFNSMSIDEVNQTHNNNQNHQNKKNNPDNRDSQNNQDNQNNKDNQDNEEIKYDNQDQNYQINEDDMYDPSKPFYAL